MILSSFIALLVAISSGNNGSLGPGMLIASGIVKRNVAIILSSIALVMGLILEGWRMSWTIPSTLGYLNANIRIAIILSVIITLILNTLIGVPISVSQLLMLSTFTIGFLNNFNLNWFLMIIIIISWIVSPLTVMILTLILYPLISSFIGNRIKDIYIVRQIGKILTMTAVIYLLYVMGASMIGLIISLEPKTSYLTIIIYSLVIFIGLFKLSSRPSIVIGYKIARLGPIITSVVIYLAALIVHIFTVFGIPVSITQCITGGVFGLGISGSIRSGRALEVIKAWSLSIVAILVLSTIFYNLLSL